VGNLNFDGFNALYNAVSGVNKDCSGREDELVGLKKIRDDQTRQLQDIVTRFRGAARAHFGPDSAEYAQAGGTPERPEVDNAQRQAGFGTTEAGFGLTGCCTSSRGF
jgi:hypothetical protein